MIFITLRILHQKYFLNFITPEEYNTEDSNSLNWIEELLGKPVMSKSFFVICRKTIIIVFAVHTQLATMQSKRFFILC